MIALLQLRDQQGFTYLYNNYAPALYGVIYRLVDDRELAEDILQESFIKIWNNFGLYDTRKGRLFTWMLNLVRNNTIDTLRSKGYKKQQKILSDENSVSNLSDPTSGAEKFDLIGLRKKITDLKPEQKTIIDMTYFEGFTQDEISKAMGIPLGTVKTRMRAALIELRKRFQGIQSKMGNKGKR